MTDQPANSNCRAIVAAGAILAMLSVILGAFAAHGLKAMLDPYQLGIFETAARYQMYHALAMLVVGALASAPGFPKRWLELSAWAFGIGILLFSGSLYLLALGAGNWLGLVTPLGGLAFILGWLLLVIAASKTGSPSRR